MYAWEIFTACAGSVDVPVMVTIPALGCAVAVTEAINSARVPGYCMRLDASAAMGWIDTR